MQPTNTWTQIPTNARAHIWSRSNHIPTMPSSTLLLITLCLACAVATVLLMICSSISAGLSPTVSTVKKKNVVIACTHYRATPTLQQNACMHITDRLRATVPAPAQAKGAGPAHARQGVEELLKCYGKRLDHKHPLTLPMEFLHEPKCINWLMANRCAGLSPVLRQRASCTIDGHHST